MDLPAPPSPLPSYEPELDFPDYTVTHIPTFGDEGVVVQPPEEPPSNKRKFTPSVPLSSSPSNEIEMSLEASGNLHISLNYLVCVAPLLKSIPDDDNRAYIRAIVEWVGAHATVGIYLIPELCQHRLYDKLFPGAVSLNNHQLTRVLIRTLVFYYYHTAILPEDNQFRQETRALCTDPRLRVFWNYL